MEHTFKFPQGEANERYSQNLLIENISITFLAILSLSHRPADQAQAQAQAQAHPHSLTEHADWKWQLRRCLSLQGTL